MLRFAIPALVALTLSAPALACGSGDACCRTDAPNAAATGQQLDKGQPGALKAGESRQVFKVTGMSCGGCAKKISSALTKVAGVISAQVSAESGEATVTFQKDKVSEAQLRETIEKTGYKIVKAAV